MVGSALTFKVGFNRYFVAVPRFFFAETPVFISFYCNKMRYKHVVILFSPAMVETNDQFIFQPQIFQLQWTLLLRRCSQCIRGCDPLGAGSVGFGDFLKVPRGIFYHVIWWFHGDLVLMNGIFGWDFPWNIISLKNGKSSFLSSISMGHGFHSYVIYNQRVFDGRNGASILQ